MKKKNNIYKQKLDKVGAFQFDEKTVSVFPDMIERSVPGYKTLVSLIGTIAAKFAKGRLVSVLEGGYNPEGLASAVEAHLKALVNIEWSDLEM